MLPCHSDPASSPACLLKNGRGGWLEHLLDTGRTLWECMLEFVEISKHLTARADCLEVAWRLWVGVMESMTGRPRHSQSGDGNSPIYGSQSGARLNESAKQGGKRD